MKCECENWRSSVFAMSNRATNSVSAFAGDACGALRFVEERVTAGSGTAEAIVDPLGSQGALALDGTGRFLFAVNAGNNTVSSFRVKRGDMTLASVLPSGGVRPVSVAISGNLLYAVNAGDANNAANVSGFSVDESGVLSPIPGSTMPLSMSNPQPACAVFSPDGRRLAVSERNTNFLIVFTVEPGGLLSNAVVTVSNGAVPFGMAFTRCGILLVTEAGPNALSSYQVLDGNALEVISGSVPNNQGATCWVSATPDGYYAYTSNAATGTISLYRVANDGGLTLIESVPSTPLLNGAPIDSAIDACGEHLYVLNGAQGSISAFRIGCEGHPRLIQIYEDTSLPEIGAQGLAAR